jgi:hypothetical protein
MFHVVQHCLHILMLLHALYAYLMLLYIASEFDGFWSCCATFVYLILLCCMVLGTVLANTHETADPAVVKLQTLLL